MTFDYGSLENSPLCISLAASRYLEMNTSFQIRPERPVPYMTIVTSETSNILQHSVLFRLSEHEKIVFLLQKAQ